MMMVPQQRTEKPNLSLYGIETQLLELLNFRDSVLDDPDMTAEEQKLSLEACDLQIAEYVRAEVKKVDGVAAYLREFEARAEALKAEAERCRAMAKAWEKRRENLTNMVIGVMQETHTTRIDGRHSVLNLRKNPPSVEVAQPDLVPHELQRRTLALTEQVYQAILNGPMGTLLLTAIAKDPEPMKAEILKRLKEGDGVPGCRLRTDGVRLEVK